MTVPEQLAAPSGVTSRLALPYPIPDDSVDVPRDMQALAAQIDLITAKRKIPLYNVTDGSGDGYLPITPPDGDPSLARISMAGVWYWAWAASGAWYCYPSGLIRANAPNPATLASGTGWRKTTLNWTAPALGVWHGWAQADLTYGAAENQGGIGMADDANYAATASPFYLGTNAQSAANYRTQCRCSFWTRNITDRVGGGDIVSLRANSGLTNTILFNRAEMYFVPTWILGTV